MNEVRRDFEFLCMRGMVKEGELRNEREQKRKESENMNWMYMYQHFTTSFHLAIGLYIFEQYSYVLIIVSLYSPLLHISLRFCIFF